MKQKENQIHFISSSYQLQNSSLNLVPWFLNCQQTCDQQFTDVKVTEHSFSHLLQ